MNPKLPLSPFATWARIFNQTEGRFFTVSFRKSNGVVRTLNGRIFGYIDESKDLKHITVRDVHAHKADPFDEGFRKVDPNAILSFKCAGFQIG